MASPWDQLFVVARKNEEAKQKAEQKPAVPDKICPECKIRPCAIVKSTGIRAAYCVECRRIKNRNYTKKCAHKK